MLGRGGFGIVYKGTRKWDQKEFAIKLSLSVFKNYTKK
jgi:serine/threonine protein kinase